MGIMQQGWSMPAGGAAWFGHPEFNWHGNAGGQWTPSNPPAGSQIIGINDYRGWVLDWQRGWLSPPDSYPLLAAYGVPGYGPGGPTPAAPSTALATIPQQVGGVMPMGGAPGAYSIGLPTGGALVLDLVALGSLAAKLYTAFVGLPPSPSKTGDASTDASNGVAYTEALAKWEQRGRQIMVVADAVKEVFRPGGVIGGR